MRGKVSDQDLTDYAANELSPEERLYVESMLAVSEECREDVYQMMDVGEMLKEGYEQEEETAELLLDDSRREKVLDVPWWTFRGVLRKVAAIAVLGGGVAFAVSQPAFWQTGGTADRFTSAGNAVQGMVENFQAKGFAKTADEVTARLMAASSTASEPSDMKFVSAPAVCTPVWATDTVPMADIVEM